MVDHQAQGQLLLQGGEGGRRRTQHVLHMTRTPDADPDGGEAEQGAQVVVSGQLA